MRLAREAAARFSGLPRSAPSSGPLSGRWPKPLSGDELVALGLGLVCLAVFGFWAAFEGGFSPTVWYPGALVAFAALLTLYVAVPAARRPPTRAVGLATLALAGYAAWSMASILWADVKGDAWDGANRALLYVAVFALFAWAPWRVFGGALVLGAFAIVTTCLLAGFLAAAAVASDPSGFFVSNRFSDPTGYPNANAALALMAFWPAVGLACRREVPTVLRALFFASAGFLLQVALLAQSRGSLFSLPVVALLALAIVPGRVRTTLAFGAIAASTVPFMPAILDVYSSEDLAAALTPAARDIAISAAILGVLGLAWGVADRRLDLGVERARRAAWVTAGVWAAAAVTALVLLFTVWGDPIDRASSAWREFTAGQPADFGTSHLTGGLGSNRYDFWRVAAEEFTGHPLLGVGADNFAVDYVRERTSSEEPSYPHSLPLKVLSQTGVVGAVLMLAFVALVIAALVQARRLSAAMARATVALCALVVVYWLVHGAVDWFWELPALGAPAFACLGIAVALASGETRRDREALPAKDTRRFDLVVAVCGVAVLAAAAVSVVLPWLAARDVDIASRDWRADPGSALARLDRARSLNPLSDHADLVAGAITSRLGDVSRMRSAFERAVERNPSNWYAYLELGVASALSGDHEEAVRFLRRAQALNPLEPTIAEVLDKVEEGVPISPDEVDLVFIRRVEQLAQ